MMNVLAIGFLISSIAAAGVWSPPLEKQQHPNRDKENVILKPGHRVILVEYEKEGFQPEIPSTIDAVAENNHLEGEKSENREHGSEKKEQSKNPIEMVCDAYGVCKEKISDMFGTTKQKLGNKIPQVDERAKQAVGDDETLTGKVKKAGEGVEKTFKDKTQFAKNLLDKGKRTGEEIAGKAKKTGENMVNRTGEEMTEIAGKVKEAGKAALNKTRDAGEIIRRGREVAYDAGIYAVSPESLRSLMAVLHLLGFCTTYGMCVWMTFASSYVLGRCLPRQQLGFVQSKIYPVYFKAMSYGIAICLISHVFMHGWFNMSTSNNADMYEAHDLLGCLGLVLLNLLFLEPRATKVAFECLRLEKEEGRGRDIADMGEPRTPAATATVTRRTTATSVGSGSSPLCSSPVITATTATAATTTTPTAGVVRAEQEVRSKWMKANRRLKNLNSYSSSLNMAVLMGLTWHLVYLAQRLHVSC